MRRGITVKETIFDRYLISETDLLKSIRESVHGNLYQYEINGDLEKVTVICDPNFMHELLSYYHWKERNAQNYLEDIFRISGQIFYDDDRLIIVPRFLLRMVSENRAKTSVVTNVVNKQGAEYQNYILEQSLLTTDYSWLRKFGPLQVIGHGHSHPDLGGIGVMPSSIDVEDHRKNLEDHVIWLSHIVDPIRGLSAFYFGTKLKCPKVIYMLYPEDKELFGKDRIVLGRVGPVTIPSHDHRVIPYDEIKDELKKDNGESTETEVEKTEMGLPEVEGFDAGFIKENVEDRVNASSVEQLSPEGYDDKRLRRIIKRTAITYVRSKEFVDRILLLIKDQIK